MPRPRVFRQGVGPSKVADLYREGRSTREIAERTGLSRWVITEQLRKQGIALRPRPDALEIARYMRSLTEEQMHAQLCHWPRCPRFAGKGSLCTSHWVELDEWEGRSCPWPSCSQRRGRDVACGYHVKRANGLID